MDANQNEQQDGANLSVQARLRQEAQNEKKAQKKRNTRRDAKSAQQALGYDLLFEDGICRVSDGVYSKMIWFSDINYQTARKDAQKNILKKYCELLNYFDNSTTMQLSIINHQVDETEFKKDVFLPFANDSLDKYRKEYNQILADKALEGQQHVSRDRYITFSTAAATYEKAVPLLSRIESDISEMLIRIGCDVHTVDGVERVKILSEHTTPDDPFTFSYKDLVKSSQTTKDVVAPAGFDFTKTDMFMCGDRYAQVLFIHKLPPDLEDSFISSIADLPINMSISFQIRAIDQGEAIQYVQRKIGYMDQEQVDVQKQSIKKGFYNAIIPHELQHSLEEAQELLEDLRGRNQRMFKVTGLIFTSAKTQEELLDNVFQIISSARKTTTVITPLKIMQREGFNSVLPLGMNHVPVERTLTTISTAVFVPFTTQELIQKHFGAMYYGQNQLSNSFILFDRKTLKNPNGWVFGTPGSGKSFGCKREILNTFLGNPNDELIIIDPENEYTPVVQALGGESVVISAASPHHLSPFDINEDYADGEDPVSFKAEFITTLCDLLAGSYNGLTPITLSVIDRVCRIIYSKVTKFTPMNEMPTFRTFYDILKQQPEQEAVTLAQSLERYIEGTLSTFSHHTNINTQARIVSYNTKQLGTQLKTFGMLVVLDQIWNRVCLNQARNIRTWIYIDEAQSFFQNDYAVDYFDKIYSRARKYGGVPTAITQNIERILLHPSARMMLNNSEFIMMFNQSTNDRQALGEMLNLSEQQLGYVTNSKEGCGLLIAGGAIVPFKDKFPSNTDLYKLITTKFEDAADGGAFTSAQQGGALPATESISIVEAQPTFVQNEIETEQSFISPTPQAGPALSGEPQTYGQLYPTQPQPQNEPQVYNQQPQTYLQGQNEMQQQTTYSTLPNESTSANIANEPAQSDEARLKEQLEEQLVSLNAELRNPGNKDVLGTLNKIQAVKNALK